MHILVFRFSAMGDVALLVPVLRKLIEKYPDLTITLVSKKYFEPLFYDIPGLVFFSADFKNRHKGLIGLYQLYKDLNLHAKYNYVIDLHNVIRSWILCFLFFFSGLKFYRINKGRKEKRRLIRKHNKKLKSLKHTTERYLDVFRKVGLEVSIGEPPWLSPSEKSLALLNIFLHQKSIPSKKGYWLGIAPFTKHPTKMWPLDKVSQLIDLIHQHLNTKIFLLGGGKEEIQQLKKLQQKHPFTINAADELSFDTQIALMHDLDVMISMDSSNMHIGSLLGVKVIAIWGSTHPYAGFSPLGQHKDHTIQVPVNQLSCRPCSVFGNIPCWRGDHACMNQISTQEVFKKVQSVLV